MAEHLRWYYVDHISKTVFVFDESQKEGTNPDFLIEVGGIEIEVEFLGSSSHPKIKGAVGSFLRGRTGYRIVDNTNKAAS